MTMKSPIVKIKELVKHLPERDIPYANVFIQDHNIESLKELIDSAYYLTKKNQAKEKVPKEYQDINLENLMDLKIEVDNYHTLLANVLGDEPYESELENELFENELNNI